MKKNVLHPWRLNLWSEIYVSIKFNVSMYTEVQTAIMEL